MTLPETRTRRWPHRLVAVVLVLVGAVVSAWPVGETLFNDSTDIAWVTEYVSEVRDIPAPVLTKQLAQAEAYNAALPPNSINDPWEDGASASSDAAHDRYLATLNGRRAMGRLRIPSIHVDLPIFHDADRLSMTYGVGHMYGSSLPVGGRGTHAVLAAHTGLSGRTRFDNLPDVKLGDAFRISISKRVLNYRVDKIDVVEPWDLDEVQRVAGQDYVTLVTCYTPPGSHKQRLLVRGVRVADASGSTTTTIVEEEPVEAETTIQTWMWPRLTIVAVAAAVAVAMLIPWPARRRNAARPVRRAGVLSSGSPTSDLPAETSRDDRS